MKKFFLFSKIFYKFSSKIEENLPKLTKIDQSELEYKFIKGSGPGGQSTNKTNNCVILRHVPSNIIIRCHDSRSLETNKHLAYKRLKEKLDLMINGEKSKQSIKNNKKIKQKIKRKKKSIEKHNVDIINSNNIN